MLVAALNLSGLFEVGASLQGLGGGLAARGGAIGAAFTGVLAVVVAAPCTAPFMGPALGYALTQPAAFALGRLPGPGPRFRRAVHAASPSPRPSSGSCRGRGPGWRYSARRWRSRCTPRRRGWPGCSPSRRAPRGLARLLAAAVVLALAGVAVRPVAGDARARAGAAPVAWRRRGRADRLLGAGRGGRRAARRQRPDRRGRGARRPSAQAARRGAPGARQLHRRLVRHLPGERAGGLLRLATSPGPSSRANAVYLVGDWTNRDARDRPGPAALRGASACRSISSTTSEGDAPTVLPQLLTPQAVTRGRSTAATPGGRPELGGLLRAPPRRKRRAP